jgi:hypothetical protein
LFWFLDLEIGIAFYASLATAAIACPASDMGVYYVGYAASRVARSWPRLRALAMIS